MLSPCRINFVVHRNAQAPCRLIGFVIAGARSRIVLGLRTYALFVRNDGALPVTERAETAFAVDEEVDLSVHTKVR